MKKITLMLALLVMTTLATLAQPPREGGRPDCPMAVGPQMDDDNGNRMDRMAARLELTDEQQAKFEQSMIENHKVMKPLQNQLDEKRAALKTLTSAEKVDKVKIDKTIHEIGELHTAILKAKVNHQIAIRAMLTDKQKMIFDQAHEGGGNMNDHRGHGPKRG
jgi:Spy/CpxP family protein refolding chaperone